MSSPADRWSDPTVAEQILRSYRVWAVVGLSSRPWRASFGVSRYLLSQGYDIVPIHPNEKLVHGKPVYPDLLSVPPDLRARIEVVDLFRRSELVLPHVEEAIAIGAKAVWMQLERLERGGRAARGGGRAAGGHEPMPGDRSPGHDRRRHRCLSRASVELAPTRPMR